MKSNRCECGRKKVEGVEKCIRCIAKDLIQIKPSNAVTEAFVDVIKDTHMAEIIKNECVIEAKPIWVGEKAPNSGYKAMPETIEGECPVEAIKPKVKIVAKPKRKRKVVE